MVRRKEQKIDFGYNFRVYLSFVNKYKLLLASVIAVVLLLEASKLVDKLLFRVIVDRGTEFVAGTLGAPSYIAILMGVATVYITISLLGVGFRWLRGHFVNRLDGHLIFDLKQRFYNHIVRLSHGFHTTHKTGALISRLNRGAGAIETMTDLMIYNTLPLLLQIVIVGGSLIYFDFKTGIVVFITALAFTFYTYILQKRQEKAYTAANNAEDIEKGMIADSFTNIDSIKYFGKEDVVRSKFRKLSDDTRKTQIKLWDYGRWIDSGQILILAIGTIFMIYFPLQAFLAGKITLGTLVFVYTVYGNVIEPLYGFSWGMRNFQRSMANFQDLFQYGKISNEVMDKPGADTSPIEHGRIELRNISFSYKKRKVFNGFNLTIPEKKRVALVGHSGSGKSTLVKLLYRFYDVEGGEINIDGRDIKNFKQEFLRSELSIVPQEAILFDDTVYNNIAFSNPKASRAEVMKAIKLAQLDKVVATFPNEEHTIVGERGVRLSGGEKQRVSIARALLADKKVLVLDEATSSLDSQTEHEIQHGLRELMKGRTSIIIAHRLSTIMSADMIVVLDKGKIVQQGTHSELIRKPGMYRKLWNLQKGGYLQDDGDKE